VGCICCGDVPRCHWSAQAEIGIGTVILVIGICFFVFNDIKVQFGLNIGILFISIIAFFIPFSLIGLCDDKTMACHRTTFPAIMIICIVLFFTAVVYMFILVKKIPSFGSSS